MVSRFSDSPKCSGSARKYQSGPGLQTPVAPAALPPSDSFGRDPLLTVGLENRNYDHPHNVFVSRRPGAVMKKHISFDQRLLENFSWPLLISLLCLCACGLINLYSVSFYADFAGGMSWFTKQSLFLGLAGAGLIAAMVLDYQYLKKIVWPLYFISLIALAAVFSPLGVKANHATRWLDLGFLQYQPSESIKIVLVVALAAWFSKKDLSGGLGFRDLLVPALIILPPFLLIHKQPDLGTALHIMVTCAPMFLVFRFRPHVIGSFILVGVLGCGIVISVIASGSWHVLLDKGIIKSHQVQRIETFLDPTKDPQRAGYHVLQAQNAVGGGQIFGRGFLGGTQHRNKFLPEPQTDFAFAAIAEEWGFVGSLVVLALFLCLLSSCLMVARRSRDRFGSLIVLGLTSLLFWQVIINVGMVIGLLPVVGIPLPFISYGGTSLVVTVVAVGLILNIGMRRYIFQDEPVQENPYVWRQVAEEEARLIVTVPVRKLALDTPYNPELHPRHRLPHIRPWAKYLRKGRSSMRGWQTPDPFEALDD